MKILLIQIIFIGQGRDGWGQLLFLAAMLAFYAVGAVINKLKKRAAEQEREGVRGAAGAARPGRGPEKRQIEAAPPVRPVSRRLTVAPAGTPAKEIVRPKTAAEIATERLIEFFGLEEMMAAEAAKRLPPVKEAKPPEILVKEPVVPKEAPAGIPEVKKAETKAPEKSLLDIKDPQDVRRAIIHYEIFGRPLSLREKSEQIAGF
jgi:hypothetical protein